MSDGRFSPRKYLSNQNFMKYTNEGSSGSSSSSAMESQSFDLDRTIHEYLSSSLQRKNADDLPDMNKKPKIFYSTNIEIKLLSLSMSPFSFPTPKYLNFASKLRFFLTVQF